MPDGASKDLKLARNAMDAKSGECENCLSVNPVRFTVMRFPGTIFNAWRALPALLIMLPLTLASHAPGAHASQQCAQSLGQPFAAQGEALQGELEILSWNIQKASNTGWAEDLAEMSDDIHLAFIQEASLQAQIPQAIPTPLVQAFAAGYTTARQDTGVMTLSSSSPSLHCIFTAWEPWLGTPKATTITEYPLQGRDERLLTINVHAVNFTFGLENLQQQFGALSTLR